MNHNDKSPPSDSSARLDALLSDFLNRDIVEPAESQPSSHATSMPLGDLFADAAAQPKSPAGAGTPAAIQKRVPVNRTEVWEATSRAGLHSESSGLPGLAADQLEKNVNSILGASAVAASGKKLLFGSLAFILLLVAGLLTWPNGRTAVPQQVSEEPAAAVSPSEIDAPPSAQTPSGTASGSDSEAHPGASEAEAASPLNNGSHDGRSSVAVLVPEVPATTGLASTVNGVLRSTASNAANLRQMPAPALGRSNLTLGAIQNLQSFQTALPQAPLPLPPDPPASALKDRVPDSSRTAAATPAVPLSKVQPVYPELARKLNVAGTVHVAIVVDTAGKVTSAKAVDGPPVLRGSAELAVKQWRFRPSTMNGKPVTGTGNVSVRFSLDRR